MYGYVVVNQPELKFKEYDRYRSYYCGLCHVLHEQSGRKGQMTLSYDMTFLVLLLTALYEPQEECVQECCTAHMIRPHTARFSLITSYVADMNVLLTYYKCMDDWIDEHKVTRRVAAASLHNQVQKVKNKYPKKAQTIASALARLSSYERENATDIDVVAACFGEVLGCVTAMYDDAWKDTLYRLGFLLGKFIYILDAYDDLEKDKKHNQYNVLYTYAKKADFDAMCEGILNMIMAECARQFELLPIIQDAQLLRNIIYSGVWTRFTQIRSRRQKEQEQKH